MAPKKLIRNNGSIVYFERVLDAQGVRRKITHRRAGEVTRRVEAIKQERKDAKLGLVFPQPKGDITFAEMADLTVKGLVVHPRSKRATEERLVRPRKEFGTKLLSVFTAEDFPEFVAGLQKDDGTPLSNTYRGHILREVRRVFDNAVELGYLPASPVRMKTPRAAKRKFDPFRSWDEVEAIADHIEGSYGPLVMFVAATGLRTQEWRALEWSDFSKDKQGHYLTIRRTIRDEAVELDAKTPDSLGDVRLTQAALDAMDEARTLLSPTGDLVFPSPEGKYLNLSNFRSRFWKPAFAETGLRYRSIDQLRHTAACLWIEAGADIYWVKEQLRHTSIDTTIRHYGRIMGRSHTRNMGLADALYAELTDPTKTSVAQEENDFD